MTINRPEDVAEARAAFDAYEAALISNDVATLINFFWRSPHATRVGIEAEFYGFESIASFRRNRVVNFCKREPVRLFITTFEGSFASIIFEYTAEVEKRPRRGRQSQFWIKLDGEWKIASAHISLMPESIDDSDPLWDRLESLGMTIDPNWRESIRSNFNTTSKLAGELMAFTLPENIEPASVFEP